MDISKFQNFHQNSSFDQNFEKKSVFQKIRASTKILIFSVKNCKSSALFHNLNLHTNKNTT